MTTIINTLSEVEVRAALEDGFLLRDVIRDKSEEKFVHFLQKAFTNEQSKMNEIEAKETISVLVNSSLNIIALGHLAKKSPSSISTQDILCDPNVLKDYLVIRNSTKLSFASAALCSLDKSQIPLLVQLVQNELDFVKIFNRVSHVLRQIGLKELEYQGLFVITCKSSANASAELLRLSK